MKMRTALVMVFRSGVGRVTCITCLFVGTILVDATFSRSSSFRPPPFCPPARTTQRHVASYVAYQNTINIAVTCCVMAAASRKYSEIGSKTSPRCPCLQITLLLLTSC
jgi:hypothetical protein